MTEKQNFEQRIAQRQGDYESAFALPTHIFSLTPFDNSDIYF